MKTKGFTLVELLAIIIILGLIAIITIPKVNDQIEKSKQNLAKDSALSYAKAIDEYTLHEQIKKNNINLNGIYNINESGNIYNESEEHIINVSGNKPTNGFLYYKDSILKKGCININNYSVILKNTEITNIVKETCDNFIPGYKIPELTTTGDGLYESTDEPGKYIYRGANPNNYIWLDENGDTVKTDEEIYRIISYEPNETIKVIRNNSIGEYAWDERDDDITTGPRHNNNNTYCNYNMEDTNAYNGCNVWANQNNTYYNNKILNTISSNFSYKYFKTDTSNSLEDVEYSGTVTADSTLNAYLNNNWLNQISISKYIDEHAFSVGGIYYGFYDTEYKGKNKGIKKERQEEKIYTWNGKIALMNITDYVLASTNKSCDSIYSNYHYNTKYYYADTEGEPATEHTPENGWPCANPNTNWMYKENLTEFTLTAYTLFKRGVWAIHSSGYIYGAYASSEYNVRPVFYLKSSTKLEGQGTIENPYYIIES